MLRHAVPIVLTFTISNLFAPLNSAKAKIDHEQAFNFCTSQPLLQKDKLEEIIVDMKNKPHDPILDEKTNEQQINAFQFFEANTCADKLMAHPDAFGAIGLQQFSSKQDWIIAWSAFNAICKSAPTGKCISDEVASAAAIREANAVAQGQTPASRVCQLALGSKTSFFQWKRCMDTVGDPHPEEQVIRSCALSVEWGAQPDGVKVGRKLSQCLRKPN